MNTNVTAVTSFSNRPWLVITRADLTAYISPDECSSPQKLKAALAKYRIVIGAKEQFDRLIEEIGAIIDYAPGDLADGVGWNGPCFQLGSGIVISPPDRQCSSVFIARGQDIPPGRALKAWKKQVANPLAGNPVALFSLSLALTGPILKLVSFSHVPAFEIIAGAGTGKSTIQRLALDMTRSQAASGGTQALVAHGDALKHPEQLVRAVQDGLLILDSGDREMKTQSPENRRKLYRSIETLASGDAGTNFCLLSSSREPVGDLLANDAAHAFSYQRLLTIDVMKDRQYGVFDRLSPGCSSSSAFAEGLRSRSARYGGVALHAFLEKLVSNEARDPDQLRQDIEGHMATFRKKAVCDDNDGDERRRVDCFAIVYAAARLAQRYKVLPSSKALGSKNAFGRAILFCYQLHCGVLPSSEPFLDRVLAAARSPDTLIAFGKNKHTKQAKAAVRKADAIVTRRSGRYQLLIRTEAITTIFHDWKFIKHRNEVTSIKIDEDEHTKIKRSVAGVALGRVFVFRLPDYWQDAQPLVE